MDMKNTEAQTTVHYVEKAPARGQRISRQPWKAYHEDRPLGTFPTKVDAIAATNECRWCE